MLGHAHGEDAMRASLAAFPGGRPARFSFDESSFSTPTTSKVLALSTAVAPAATAARSNSAALSVGGLRDPLKRAAVTLAYITGKVSAMVFVNRLNLVTMQVQEMEKDQELSDDIELMDILSPARSQHELNVWRGFLPKVKLGVFFECNVVAVFQMLETLVRGNLSRKTARSLTKQVAASAVRKSARATAADWSATQLAGKVFQSAFKAQTLYWSALFIVSVAFDAIHTVSGKYSTGALALFVPRAKIEGSFARRTWVYFLDCSKKCVLTAIGAAIGTLIRPGLGTTVGMVFFPSLAGGVK